MDAESPQRGLSDDLIERIAAIVDNWRTEASVHAENGCHCGWIWVVELLAGDVSPHAEPLGERVDFADGSRTVMPDAEAAFRNSPPPGSPLGGRFV